jgi:AcrR family transcriptional regulator
VPSARGRCSPLPSATEHGAGILAIATARPNKSSETREQIVGAAVALLDAEGAAGLSTRRLARELGIRGPTLYHYFASKDALVDAVAQRIVDEIWAAVQERLDAVGPGDWEGALRGALAVMGRHPNAVGVLALRPVSNRRTLEIQADPSLDAGFGVGLDALIDGIAAALAAQR